jgi:hypothetical protein
MKRVITGLALAAAAALIAATPAQAATSAAPKPAAAPGNPAAAIKKQFVAGKGVKFTERATGAEGSQRFVVTRRTGTYQFSDTGIAASDSTGVINGEALLVDDGKKRTKEDEETLAALKSPEHVITVGKAVYLSGGFWGRMLPADKSWFKVSKKLPLSPLTTIYAQPISLTETATLKTLLKGAKPAPGGYAGKTTVGELRKISPSFRHGVFADTGSDKKAAKMAISWKLAVDAHGLPTRLVTTFRVSAKSSFSVDTRYSDWGSAVSITAPPADEVTDEIKIDEGEVPQIVVPLSGISKP